MIHMTASVRTAGPLIEQDPGHYVEGEIRNEVRETTDEAARLAQDVLQPGHGVRTGEYKSSIHGTIRDSMHGEITDGNAAVGAWLEGVSSRNETSRFKGYHHFRIAGQEIRKRAHARAEKLADRIARRLS
jgi:hypothetical protein